MYYILENRIPKEVKDIVEWAKHRKDDSVVKQVFIGEVKVSTVFLGIDHSFDGGTPVLFETMIFGGEHDQEQWRYTTWGEAEKGHEKACDLVRKS